MAYCRIQVSDLPRLQEKYRIISCLSSGIANMYQFKRKKNWIEFIGWIIWRKQKIVSSYSLQWCAVICFGLCFKFLLESILCGRFWSVEQPLWQIAFEQFLFNFVVCPFLFGLCDVNEFHCRPHWTEKNQYVFSKCNRIYRVFYSYQHDSIDAG